MEHHARQQQTTDDSASYMTGDTLPDDIDLTAPDSGEEEVAPPPYRDTPGEIHNEKNGLGTSARVTEDGRVDIRINQLNRRLSQIFVPALRQQAQNEEDSQPPPPPYIPPSLGGAEGVPPPPSLNVVIQVVGSRGDVQPFIALGRILKNTYGHRVRLATHPNFKDFVEEHGLEFFSIGGDPSLLMAFMVKNPGLMPGFRSIVSGDVAQRKRDVAEYIQGCWRSCYKAGNGMDDGSPESSGDEPSARPFVADCIIANPPSFAHIHCAEKLGVPLHIMFTMPYSPTQAMPHPLANIQDSNADPQLTNYISYAMIELLSWQGLGEIINRFRAKCLGLDPLSLIWAPGMLQRLKVPHTYCWSPALIPKPKDWGAHISLSGFWFLDLATDYAPPADLQAFLNAGPPPIYIGFGSIVLDDPNAMTELIFDAIRKLEPNQRVLLSKGWGGLASNELNIPDNVFMLGNVPHDWLFKHVSCVVHHGGAGTTAAGISAGRPTVVVPFFGDQPFWGAMVARAGAGPDPIPHKQLAADNLAEAITFCLRPESLERAREMGDKIAAERGTDTGAQLFHQYLEPDRLRCTITPSRAAVWRVKRTKVKLSAFAAATLTNAKLLDVGDLELFRAQEYLTDQGPSDPISGGASMVVGAFGSMMSGVADFPTETWKAVSMSIAASRTKSLESAQTSANASTTSLSTPDPTTRTSLEKQQTTSTKSNPSSTKEQSMMHRTGAHTSKGLGKMARTMLEAPMDFSISMTKGFHNVPRLWGDDTVRPVEQVRDMKSSMKVMGKEFGFGMYDGITGLVTQPWRGARKEGTVGFFKGMGKGLGGFATKPGAAMFAVPAYFFKGTQLEILKAFRGSVRDYVVASRAAQGHEEWLKASEGEKEDVVVRWKLLQKDLKKRRKPDSGKGDGSRAVVDPESAMLAMGVSSSPRPSTSTSLAPEGMQVDEKASLPVEEDADAVLTLQDTISQLQTERRIVADRQAEDDDVRKVMAASEAEAQQRTNEDRDYQRQFDRALARSLREQRRSEDSPVSSHGGLESPLALDDNEEEEFERARRRSEALIGSSSAGGTILAESSGAQIRRAKDASHFQGTSQGEFEAQRQWPKGEKTTQEKTEEEIVMEYMKKQSLMEAAHQSASGAPNTGTEAQDDQELQEALKLSMQACGGRPGAASGQ